MLKRFQHFLFGIFLEKEKASPINLNTKEVLMSMTKWNNGQNMTTLFDDFFTRDLLNWGLTNNFNDQHHHSRREHQGNG